MTTSASSGAITIGTIGNATVVSSDQCLNGTILTMVRVTLSVLAPILPSNAVPSLNFSAVKFTSASGNQTATTLRISQVDPLLTTVPKSFRLREGNVLAPYAAPKRLLNPLSTDGGSSPFAVVEEKKFSVLSGIEDRF